MTKIMKIQMVLNAVHRTLTTELPNASTQKRSLFLDEWKIHVYSWKLTQF